MKSNSDRDLGTDLLELKRTLENKKAADFLVAEAKRFLELKEFVAARECLREALIRNPMHEEAIKLLAESLLMFSKK